MPSASAKIEKIASIEAADPVKQIIIALEKKVRNLEKRKLKLDNYKSDVQNGKELNEDQKNAVSKYDQVVEVLDFSKELSKLFSSIVLESSRAQKKLAKKEQIERQQHEIQRLQEALYYKHILSCLENEEIRNDFLNGDNGAPKLTSEDLSHLDQFYKLIGPSLPNDQADIEGHFHTLAENLIFLVEGKNKEVAGTTYKILKELLHSMKISGYFQRPSESNEGEETSSDDIPDVEDAAAEKEKTDESYPPVVEETVTVNGQVDSAPEEKIEQEIEVTSSDEVPNGIVTSDDGTPDQSSYTVHNGPLQEVLSSHGSFNFLQESQIDIDTPHMDPAVVAVHQRAPPPTMNFSVNAYQPSHSSEEPSNQLNTETEHSEVSVPVQQQIPVLPTAIPPRTIPPVIPSVPHSNGHEFDPNHPIPTQTFTNQNFAVMQNIMLPQAYVPVTMHHGPLPPHMTPLAVVPGLSSPVTTPSSCSVPLHVTMAQVPVSAVANPIVTEASNEEMTSGDSQQPTTNGNLSSPETETFQVDNSEKPVNDSEGFTTQNSFRGGYRGRGRGRGQTNGYYRGRGNYNNGRGYQGYNNYHQGGGGGNYRRGNIRGGLRGNGNMRNRPNNRQQLQQQQPQQQQQQQQ